MKRTHVAAVAALVVLAVPALTGCFNGLAATTTTQASMNSGNGVEADQGAMHIENATLVLGPEGSTSGTLIMRVVNVGPEPDALTYATINGVQVEVVPTEIGPGQSVSFGYESDLFINTFELDVPPSSYVPVELGFDKAGIATLSVLTVPPTGIYTGIVPTPATQTAP